MSLVNFNSIKVRLELIAALKTTTTTTFQFHKGAIRTYYLSLPYVLHRHFNSIKVRLEPAISREKAKAIAHFNSIKVRLEHGDDSWRIPIHLFQFHKGAIRTRKRSS